jgi:membrane peptidoglycan carboxypeptidase
MAPLMKMRERPAMTVGLKEVIVAARELGLDAPLKEVPSMALGTNEVSLLDLTGAFASIRAGRAKLEPWGITVFASDAGGLRSLGAPAAPEGELPHKEQLTRLLRDVVEHGTGRAAAVNGASVAGKTGTSQDYRDAWFVGFTDDLVVGVWTGNDDRSPMKGITGGSLPAQIWKNFVTAATPLLARSNKPEVAEGTEPTSPSQASTQPQCNQTACAVRYNSFRASDCTYQPYSGPRRLCDIQDGSVEARRKDGRGGAKKADLTSNKGDLSTSLHDTERDMGPPEEGSSRTSPRSRREAAMGLGTRDMARPDPRPPVPESRPPSFGPSIFRQFDQKGSH